MAGEVLFDDLVSVSKRFIHPLVRSDTNVLAACLLQHILDLL